MQSNVSEPFRLQRDKRELLDNMLELTREMAAHPTSSEHVLRLLSEREVLMARVTQIDQELGQLEVPVAGTFEVEEIRRCLEGLHALNEFILTQATARRAMLVAELVAGPR